MNDFQMWLGSETSHKETLSNLVKVSLASSEYFDPTEYDLLSIQDGVGVINIVGNLVTNAPPWATMFGVIGYNVIKDTLTIAAQDDSISQIILNIDSPGGSANGIDSVASLIQKISAEYKPVVSFTEGKMCSAAYWIGAATNSIQATRLATLGSIGGIAVSMEYTKAMEQAGVTPTVFRAGEFKALGSPYESLTEKASAEIQKQLDTLYTEFITHIAAARNLPVSTASTSWGEGRTFLGFEAQKVNLVDGVTTFEDLASNLKKHSMQSHGGRLALNMEEPDMKKRTLGSKANAVLAATGSMEAALAVEGAEGVDLAQAEASKPAAAEPEANATVEPEATTARPVDTDLVSYLQTSLKTAQEQVVSLTIENKELSTKNAAVTSVHDSLRSIVLDSITVRGIALGRSPGDLSSLSDEALVQTHMQVTADFHKTFPVGGLTDAPSTATSEPKTLTPAAKRAIDAARIGGKHG